MKKFCAVLLFFCFASSALAQNSPPSPQDMVARMKAKLNLTDDQVASITPILERYADKRQELRQSMDDGTMDKSTLHTRMKELREDELQELSKILSADQIAQWKAMMPKGHHQDPPPDHQS